MTGVLELGAVTLFVGTSVSTLGLSSYAHAKQRGTGCFQGLFTKKPIHQRQNTHHLDPPHQTKLLEGPLRKDGVQVKLNRTLVGKQDVQFNGEILFIGDSAKGVVPVPAIALGACDVKVYESRVVATPLAIPSVEITFESPEEAQRWATEMKEGALLGPSHDRIQELILHSIRVEKYLIDLRARTTKVAKLEQSHRTLRQHIAHHMGGKPDESTTENRRSSTAGVLSSWFGANSSGGDPEAMQKLTEELHERHNEVENQKKLNRQLTQKVVENARTDGIVASRWRYLVNAKVRQSESQSGPPPQTPQLDEVAPEIQDLLPSSPSISQSSQAQLTPKVAPSDFEQRFQDAENQLALYRQRFQDEKLRSGCPSARMPIAPGVGKEALTAHLGLQFTKTDKLLSMAPSTTFKSLEERIRDHQLQVLQDCDVLQKSARLTQDSARLVQQDCGSLQPSARRQVKPIESQ